MGADIRRFEMNPPINNATVFDNDSESHPCEIVDLPFYDPEKLIARGIEKPIV